MMDSLSISLSLSFSAAAAAGKAAGEQREIAYVHIIIMPLFMT